MVISCMYVFVIWSLRAHTFMLFYKFLHKLHLQESRFGADFKWDGRLFQIFRPKIRNLFLAYLTWFGLVNFDSKHPIFVRGFFVSFRYLQNLR